MLILTLLLTALLVAAVVLYERRAKKVRHDHADELRRAKSETEEVRREHDKVAASVFTKMRDAVVASHPEHVAAFAAVEAFAGGGFKVILDDLAERTRVMKSATDTCRESVHAANMKAEMTKAHNIILRRLLDTAVMLPSETTASRRSEIMGHVARELGGADPALMAFADAYLKTKEGEA